MFPKGPREGRFLIEALKNAALEPPLARVRLRLTRAVPLTQGTWPIALKFLLQSSLTKLVALTEVSVICGFIGVTLEGELFFELENDRLEVIYKSSESEKRRRDF